MIETQWICWFLLQQVRFYVNPSDSPSLRRSRTEGMSLDRQLVFWAKWQLWLQLKMATFWKNDFFAVGLNWVAEYIFVAFLPLGQTAPGFFSEALLDSSVKALASHQDFWGRTIQITIIAEMTKSMTVSFVCSPKALRGGHWVIGSKNESNNICGRACCK